MIFEQHAKPTMNEIWILECGCYYDPADCGGYYQTKEEALKHPLFEKYCINVEPLVNNYFSKPMYSWEDGNRWISLYCKPINKHFISTEMAADGQILTWEDMLK